MNDKHLRVWRTAAFYVMVFAPLVAVPMFLYKLEDLTPDVVVTRAGQTTFVHHRDVMTPYRPYGVALFALAVVALVVIVVTTVQLNAERRHRELMEASRQRG